MSKSDRAALTAALDASVSAINALRVEAESVFEVSRSVMLRLAVQLWTGGETLAQLRPDVSVIDWAVAQAHGFGADGGDISPPTAYRLRHAGCVATSLGEKLSGDVSYTSLVPLYRILAASAAKPETEQRKALATVTRLWASAVRAAGRRGRPTEEQVKQLAEGVMPTGTRGAKGRTAKGRAAAKTRNRAASAVAAQEKNEPTKGRVKTDPEVIESGDLEAAMGVVSSMFKSWTTDKPSVPGIMLATVRLCEEHGCAVIGASIKALVTQAAKQKQEQKQAPTTAPVKTTTRRPRRKAPVAA